MTGQQTANERGGNKLNGCKEVRAENGSGQGQHLAPTGLSVQSSLDIGARSTHRQAAKRCLRLNTFSRCRGTSLIINTPFQEPRSWTTVRVYGGSGGGGADSYERGTPVTPAPPSAEGTAGPLPWKA